VIAMTNDCHVSAGSLELYVGRSCCSVLQDTALFCSVLQCISAYCSVLQCIAAYCSVLQCVAVLCI